MHRPKRLLASYAKTDRSLSLPHLANDILDNIANGFINMTEHLRTQHTTPCNAPKGFWHHTQRQTAVCLYHALQMIFLIVLQIFFY